MYISKNHPNPPRPLAPPAEQGQRLGTFPRGEGVELRLNLSTFKGHDFLSLRVFERDQNGGWWPVKGKGVSIRLAEAGPIGDILASIAEGEIPEPRNLTNLTPEKGPAEHRPPATPFTQLAPEKGPVPRQATPRSSATPPWEGPAAFDPERPTYNDRRSRPTARNDRELPPVTRSELPFDEIG